MSAADYIDQALTQYDQLFEVMDRIITPQAYFDLFKKLSDNYSPSLTVSAVQGPLVEAYMSSGLGSASPVKVDRSLRRSGTIGVTVGSEPAPVWLSAHGDICGYLTGPYNGKGYPLTPFCMTRSRPGRRAAMALGINEGTGPLPRLGEGMMVTEADGSVWFETTRSDLPMWTQVVHHMDAVWDQATDEFCGFLDNEAGSAVVLLAAKVLSHFPVNAVILMNDEEEGPVDKGNTMFSRANMRLFHRTPTELLPELVISVDGHQQEQALEAGRATNFKQGALFSGMTSMARGAVTPPRLVGFQRALSAKLAEHGISLVENKEGISRSDDVSSMFYTQNIVHVGYPAAYSHFDRKPFGYVSDMVHLARTLVIYALIAQNSDWRSAYL